MRHRHPGDESPNAEVELIDVTARALLKIGFDGFTVNINDRRFSGGCSRAWALPPTPWTRSRITFDKMDKVGPRRPGRADRKGPARRCHPAAGRLPGPGGCDPGAGGRPVRRPRHRRRFEVCACHRRRLARASTRWPTPQPGPGQGYTPAWCSRWCAPSLPAQWPAAPLRQHCGKFLGQQVPAVGFSIGFERVCGILLEQGYQIPGAKQKIALLYPAGADFPAVLPRPRLCGPTTASPFWPRAKSWANSWLPWKPPVSPGPPLRAKTKSSGLRSASNHSPVLCGGPAGLPLF